MRYRETKDRSAELLRLTLPLMARQEAAFHPQSYTIWYEHNAGINPRLSSELERRQVANTPLTDDDVWRLHASYVVARDAEAMERMQQQLQALLQDTAVAASTAGEEASHFTVTLATHGRQLLQPLALELIRNIVADLIVDTEKMRLVTKELAEQLERNARDVRCLTEQLEQAEHQALLDPLSGLLNRRGLYKKIDSRIAEHGGLGGGILLVADIDHFKVINDNYGHVLGDKVIRAVAQVLCENTKGRDIAARIGGQEFAIFLPDTDVGGATILSERIRTSVAARTIRRSDGDRPAGRVTLSIGIAEATATSSLDSMIAQADAAMYAAKRAGRNRVSVHDRQGVKI